VRPDVLPRVGRRLILLFPGWKFDSTIWSNLRRITNRLSLLLVALIWFELSQSGSFDAVSQFARVLPIWSIAYFVLTVASVIFVGSLENDFVPQPLRLIGDIVVSGAICVVSFAVLYSSIGLIDTLERAAVIRGIDYLYFSIVSFSTLGYGDLRIEESGRIWAGSQAVLGNLHLGLLAGGVFFALQQGTKSRKR
jgi:voltage-gated potassium channel